MLLDEVIQHLVPTGKTARPYLLLDCTLGGGGHSEAMLSRVDDARLIGIDRDQRAIDRVKKRLSSYEDRVLLMCESFANVAAVCEQIEDSRPALLTDEDYPIRFDGILADLGFSSDQLDDPERGFSFQADGPLDMRYNEGAQRSAADILNEDNANELQKMFAIGGVGSERHPLVKKIIASRPIQTTQQFSQICQDVFRTGRLGRTLKKTHHAATVPFQALRIAVNEELKHLEQLLSSAPSLLAPSGRLAIISFHSLEDRLVTREMRSWSRARSTPRGLPQLASDEPLGNLLTKSAIVASEQETADNPRARSARLRIFECK